MATILITIVHVIVCFALILIVLLQTGKGADMGAAFGSGASGSLFGATGSANFLSRTTGVLAAVFFATSLSLAYVASSKPKTTGSVMEETVQSQPVSKPAVAGDEVPAAPVDGGPKAKDDAGAKAKDDTRSKAKDIPK